MVVNVWCSQGTNGHLRKGLRYDVATANPKLAHASGLPERIVVCRARHHQDKPNRNEVLYA